MSQRHKVVESLDFFYFILRRGLPQMQATMVLVVKFPANRMDISLNYQDLSMSRGDLK